MEANDLIIKILKQQVELFLLDAGEFFPFGTCIGKNNEIIPYAAYIKAENDRPDSLPLINLLEQGIKKGIANGDYIKGAIAVDILLTEDGEKCDAIKISIWEKDRSEEIFVRYLNHQSYVKFF